MRRTMQVVRNFCAVTILAGNLFSAAAWACTGIELKAADNSAVNGRTVEFGMPLQLSAIIIPRDYTFKGTLPDGSNGVVYKSKYGVVGGVAFGESAVMDGLNEKGLSVGVFYFPGYAQYANITEQNKNKALSPTEFSNWVLTQFATIDEIKNALNSVVIAPTTPKGWPGLPPFHYVVYDKSGKSIVIEPVNGELKVYDNPLGVFTNSPTFDWQLTNLANYINLSPINAPPKNVDGVTLKQFGEGSGLHGLPGDFTPPSRFVRAAVFSSNAIPAASATAAVLQAFHILNQFDIPVGAVRTVQNNQVHSEFTLATTVKDPQSLKYYFRTFEDQSIKVINLTAFDLNAKDIKSISMSGVQPVLDVSRTAK